MRNLNFIKGEVKLIRRFDSSSSDEDEEYTYTSRRSTKISASEISLESEKSYSPVFTIPGIQNTFTYLTFNLKWMYFVTVIHTIFFIIESYLEIFVNYFDSFENVMFTLCCNIVYLLDTSSALLHYFARDVSKEIHKKRNRIILFMDIACLIITTIMLAPVLSKVKLLTIVDQFVIAFRLHRGVEYIIIISNYPGDNNIIVLFRKYLFIFFVISHLFVLVWQYINSYDFYRKSGTWSDTIDDVVVHKDLTHFDWFKICLYCVLSSATVGLGIQHSFNYYENFILVILMITRVTVVTGLFLGRCISVQFDTYKRHSEFSDRLKVIEKNLTHTRVSKKLKKKILRYYIMFWRQQGAIRDSNLFKTFPGSIKKEVKVDKYWNSFMQSHLFRNIHPAYKRALAEVMATEIYAQGEVIIPQGTVNNRMIYIARGTVQILSGNDGESPLLTLDMGTVIGEVGLMYNLATPCQVIASSFCIIHYLKTCTLWRVMLDYKKLQQTKKLHKIFQEKLQYARQKHEEKQIKMKKDLIDNKIEEKALKKIKQMIEKKLKENQDGSLLKEKKSGKKYYINEQGLADLYIASKQQTALRHTDEICLNTTWPWVLQPESSFLNLWESIVFLTVLYVALVYPYEICYERYISNIIGLTTVVVNMVYVLDILIQLCSAIEDDQGVHSQIHVLVQKRLRNFWFLMDCVAAIPLQLIVSFLQITINQRILTIARVNKIFKIHRVLQFFTKLENSFKFNMSLIRGIKYLITVILLSYFMACFIYTWSCFWPVCKTGGWFHVLQDIDRQKGSSRTKAPFELSLMYTMLILTGSGLSRIYAYNVDEMTILIFYFVIAIMIFTFLIADCASTLLLANSHFNAYVQMVQIINKFMQTNKIPSYLQKRTNSHLTTQWLHKKGILTQQLMHDLPTYLFEEQQSAKFTLPLNLVPLFKEIDTFFIRSLATSCHSILLPPNEIVVYAGQVSVDMYIIEKGYCQFISAITGKVEKVLESGEQFYSLEMLIKQPGIFNVKTLTHVLLIKINYDDIMRALASYPEIKEALNRTVEEVRSSIGLQRLFVRSRTRVYHEMIKNDSKSWFVFPKKKLDPRNIDYLKVFNSMGVWKFYKYILLRRTIYPDSKFLCLWEFFRGIFAFLTGMIYPPMILYYLYFPPSRYIGFILDLTAFADIYVRLHVCYYNSMGILVTHPKCTALYYLTHSFMIDLIGALPMDEILRILWDIDITYKLSLTNTYYKGRTIVRFLKLLQIYRLPTAFSYFTLDMFKPLGAILIVLKYCSFILVLLNALTTTLILLSFEVYYDQQTKSINLIPYNKSWLTAKQITFTYTFSSLNIFFTAFYWVGSTMMCINLGNVIAVNRTEIYFIIFCIITGYLLFTYFIVIISTSTSFINLNLTLYQQRMKNMLTYMRDEKIPKKLQNDIINHYEYIWKRTHGMKAGNILMQCHTALKEDCGLALYEQTLNQIPVFTDADVSFYRILSTNLTDNYFLKGSTIIKLNDIISMTYIVHKGEVSVIGPDGSIFAVLERGSMFGNLDDVAECRSMVSVMVTTTADILSLKTVKMYEIVKNYKWTYSRLKKYVIIENMSYISKKKSQFTSRQSSLYFSVPIDQGWRSFPSRFLKSRKYNLMMMVFSYCSCIVVSYHAGFQRHTISVFFFTYFFDVFHLIQLYTVFSLPYYDVMGELISDSNMIKKKVLQLPTFYLNIIAALPLEIFCPIAPSNHVLLYLSFLRINKVLRVSNIFTFFSEISDYLNVNVLVTRFGSLVIYLSLLIHVYCCILYAGACPLGVCRKDSWVNLPDSNTLCQHPYECALFYVISIVSFIGHDDIVPRSLFDVIASTILVILARFALAAYVGHITSMVCSLTSTLVEYDCSIKELKQYLRNGQISPTLRKKVVRYSLYLWRKNRGVQIPELLLDAPTPMIKELKKAAYGKHLYHNFVFQNCHKDFLDLVIGKLKLVTFFRGDIIVQQGDIDNTMYFVHEGVIDVFAVTEKEEDQIDELREMDCFGMLQGLLINCPHTHTYIANTVVVLLTLELSEWNILLKFYPASRHTIYKRLQKI